MNSRVNSFMITLILLILIEAGAAGASLDSRWRLEGEVSAKKAVAIGRRVYTGFQGIDIGLRWTHWDPQDPILQGLQHLKVDLLSLDADYLLFPLGGCDVLGFRPYAGIGGSIGCNQSEWMQGRQQLSRSFHKGLVLGRGIVGLECFSGGWLDFFAQLEYVPALMVYERKGGWERMDDFFSVRLGYLF